MGAKNHRSFFDGNGGVQSAGVRRLFTDQVDLMDQMDKMGAPRYTSRFCGAAVVYGSGADLPQGDYFPDAPTKNSILSILSIHIKRRWVDIVNHSGYTEKRVLKITAMA